MFLEYGTDGGLIYTPYNDLHKLFACCYDFADKVKKYSNYFCLDFYKRNNSFINFICLKELNDLKIEKDNDIKENYPFFVSERLERKYGERVDSSNIIRYEFQKLFVAARLFRTVLKYMLKLIKKNNIEDKKNIAEILDDFNGFNENVDYLFDVFNQSW